MEMALKRFISFFFSCYLLSGPIYGQKIKLFLGLDGGPSFFYYSLKENPPILLDNKNETGYEGGFVCRLMNENNKTGIITGIHYAVRHYSFRFNFFYNDPQDPTIPFREQITTGFIEIPLIVHYNIINGRKLSLGAALGVNNSFHVSRRIVTTYLNGREDHTDFYLNLFKNKDAPYLFSTHMHMQFDYSLSDRMTIGVSPGFTFFLNEMNRELFKKGSTAITAKIGLQYRIN